MTPIGTDKCVNVYSIHYFFIFFSLFIFLKEAIELDYVNEQNYFLLKCNDVFFFGKKHQIKDYRINRNNKNDIKTHCVASHNLNVLVCRFKVPTP